MIVSKKKTDLVKMDLLKAIEKGLYPVGTALPSSRDLAQNYGVSSFTVREALSNLHEAGVLTIAHGKSTRVLALPDHHSILLISTLHGLNASEFGKDFITGIVKELSEHPAYTLHLRTLDTAAAQSEIRLFEPGVTGGTILYGTAHARALMVLRRSKRPFLSLHDHAVNSEDAYVSVDMRNAIGTIVAAFAARGCRRPVMLSHAQEPGINTIKEAFFCAALEQNDRFIPAQPRPVISIQTEQEVFLMTKKLLSLPKNSRPDAVFLASDKFAPAFYRAAFELHCRIPEDIAVAGCDNLAIGSYMIPSLTTIELNRELQGRLAVRNLIAALESDGCNPGQTEVTAQVIERESLRIPKSL